MKKRWICLLCGWMGLAQAMQAVTEDKPPYNWRDEQGVVTGYSVALLHELLERSQLTLDQPVRLLPWARAYQLTQLNPDTLLFSTARIPERESLFMWIGPITTSNTIWFWRLASRKDIPAADIKQMSAKWRVGVVRSSAYRVQLERDGFRVRAVNQDDDKYQGLLHGRVDLIAAPETEVIFQLKRLGVDRNHLERVLPYNTHYDYYFVANKQSDPNKIKALQRALDEMRRDGSLVRLKHKWLE